MAVAGLATVDPRTAERALRDGVDVIRPRDVRERVAAAIRAVEARDGAFGPTALAPMNGARIGD